jgi:23S rRNA pseudouridine1911/1915/1917 synthase
LVAPNYNSAAEGGSKPEGVVVDIPASCSGLRLDQALARLLPEHSRSRIRKWIDAGRVSLVGTAVDATRRVDGGERIVVQPLPDPRAAAFTPQPIPLAVVYEDAASSTLAAATGTVRWPMHCSTTRPNSP